MCGLTFSACPFTSSLHSPRHSPPPCLPFQLASYNLQHILILHCDGSFNGVVGFASPTLHSLSFSNKISHPCHFSSKPTLLQAKMLKSAVYPKCEARDRSDRGFDLQQDFSEFLEEARRHARQQNSQRSSPHEDTAGKGRSIEEKRSKKSWKNTLFSWWQVNKKSKSTVEQAPCSRISDPRCGHVSGPIYGTSARTDSRQRRPTSGPLTTLFNPTRRAETDVPYVSLNHLSTPHAQAYGPVYLVT